MRNLVEGAYAHLLAGSTSGALTLLQRALALRPMRPPTAAQQPRTGWAAPSTVRIALRTLGGFELAIDGLPLAVGKKPARRTLALLKAIVALGGRDVCRWSIADALWPDVDGDRAQNALEVALHRLRLRLGVPEALISRQGCLCLNPDLVWVDAFALCATAEAADPGGQGAPVEHTFALYRGPFLPHDSDCAWSARMRERLRARFARLVASAAATLESRSQWEEAITLYQRGIEADDEVTAFRDGLARCLDRLGRRPEPRTAGWHAAAAGSAPEPN
jgi:DNA-binding SARP family transcriptional activator